MMQPSIVLMPRSDFNAISVPAPQRCFATTTVFEELDLSCEGRAVDMFTCAKSHLTLVTSTRSSLRQSSFECLPSAVRILVSAFPRVPDRSTRWRLTLGEGSLSMLFPREAPVAPATTRPVIPRPAPISTIKGFFPSLDLLLEIRPRCRTWPSMLAIWRRWRGPPALIRCLAIACVNLPELFPCFAPGSLSCNSVDDGLGVTSEIPSST
mmetsp:Transcript_36709/g.77034  ORF Transcript_36709/g.77034 Transcript_36709/m.77034 type:complete len:209 (-) Transcript_36709:755-1381(-)